MAEQKKMNIYEKLLNIRKEFLEAGVQKTGLNKSGEYDYFQLQDIIPVATELFLKYRVIFLVTFLTGSPSGELVDIDDPESRIGFFSRSLDGPILTPANDKKIMTDIQGEGAKETYYRRYLYMQLLDICVTDELDPNPNSTPKKESKTTKAKKEKPVTPVERVEIATTVANNGGQAEQMQIEQIKKKLTELVKIAPDKEEFVQQVVISSENFTKLNKESASQLLTMLGTMIDNATTEAN